MRKLLFLAAVISVLAVATFGFEAQQRGQRGGQQPAPAATPTADPYANNAAPGTTQFPLAAPAGKDSNSLNTVPNGAVNQGPYDMSKWKYGHAFDAPEGSKIWNPVKLKMMKGEKVTGGTLFNSTDPAVYCPMAK